MKNPPIFSKAFCAEVGLTNFSLCLSIVSLNVLLAIAIALNTSIDYLLSDQYENSSLALDNEILRAITNCDNEKKEKILKIIEII